MAKNSLYLIKLKRKAIANFAMAHLYFLLKTVITMNSAKKIIISAYSSVKLC